MTLDEAIKHCEEVAERNEKQASWFWIKEGNPNYENLMECEAEHRQLAEWLRELKRADTLLKATYDLLSKQNWNYYVLKLLAEPIYYDGAECDGNCLLEDIEAWMDERGMDHDTTRN